MAKGIKKVKTFEGFLIVGRGTCEECGECEGWFRKQGADFVNKHYNKALLFQKHKGNKPLGKKLCHSCYAPLDNKDMDPGEVIGTDE